MGHYDGVAFPMDRQRWVLRPSCFFTWHGMTHLTGQRTPGCWRQPSFPTVNHCSLRGESWQPGSSQMGVSLPWWATPSLGTHSLCPSFASKPQALTTESALSLWRTHLRREVSEGQTTHSRGHPRHSSLQWRVRGWQPQPARPSPALAPYESPLGSCCT